MASNKVGNMQKCLRRRTVDYQAGKGRGCQNTVLLLSLKTQWNMSTLYTQIATECLIIGLSLCWPVGLPSLSLLTGPAGQGDEPVSSRMLPVWAGSGYWWNIVIFKTFLKFTANRSQVEDWWTHLHVFPKHMFYVFVSICFLGSCFHRTINK